ncbi:MAG: ATP-dependent zinc metalloprotease FtsH, partial [Planctomycetota bacterium]
ENGRIEAWPRGSTGPLPEIHTLPDGDALRSSFTNELEQLTNKSLPDGATKVLRSYHFKRENQVLVFLVEHLLPFLMVFFLVWFLFLRPMRMGGGIGSALNFGRSRATTIGKGKTGVTFADVAGIDEAKEEVQEVIEFLRNPSKFQRLGGRIPRGVLLVGPPGTGKTLLAKAIAGEADVPFFSISGSDFVEMFVGVGASRVRDLFQQAKAKSPCIIFLDEIDAVGRKRGVAVGGGGDEREQTLNAILVEMDGIETQSEVVVIASTNRADVLDSALLRPGRFDRQVYVDLPDILGREQILKVHARKVKMSAEVDLHRLALRTAGFSGADLAATLNEAALSASMKAKEGIDNADLEEARDKIAFGKKKRSRMAAMTEDDKRVTAYHEAGHAVLSDVLPNTEPVYKVTIIPTGRALGMTMFMPEKEEVHMTRQRLLNHLVVGYGGRVAEEIFCGDISTGAHNDIEQATRVARAMVVEYGMSEKLGPINYLGDRDETFGMRSQNHGDLLNEQIDQEVRKIVDASYQRARDLLTEHAQYVKDIARYLMVYETLDRDDLNRIRKGLPPERVMAPVSVELKGPPSSAMPETPAKPIAAPGDDMGLTPAL